ncbi:hypothetical protein GCM10022384_55690 [Streptomyces marokkonensis]|uniref:Uncharacterized protein n=1 Tax=Streptomyces marokkonensis TaxID=324855 RepID=A0ABP7RSQ2_9ACTN
MEQRGKYALPQYAADAVTRMLVGHVYRFMPFAVDVYRLFVTERFRAHGQPQGIDLVAVARHARRAGRLFLLRDMMLVLCLAPLVAGLVECVMAFLAEDGARLGRGVTFLLGALVAGTLVVVAWVWGMWGLAQRVQWGATPPRDSAPAADARLEQELDALDDANVIVYSAQGPEGDQPFLGSGVYVLENVWAGIDVGRPAKDDTGEKLTVEEFTAQELHGYVAEHVADIAGIEELRAHNRLYIQGHHARDLDAELLPDRLRRPVNRIDPALVEAGVTETGDVMRTYLTFELVGTRGSYVVTMHVRARLVRARLSWEVSAYYLPPVLSELAERTVRPLDLGPHAVQVLRVSRRQFRSDLFGSARRMLHRPLRRLADAARLLWRRYRISRPRSDFDYGAYGTLRATAASLEREWDYTQRMDARDAIQRIQQALLHATERFLTEHHIDTSDLRQAHKAITNQTYNFSGPISGQNNFGDRGINIVSGHHPGFGPVRGPGPASGSGSGSGSGSTNVHSPASSAPSGSSAK